MGASISNILKRAFSFPIKRKPICYHRQEDFSSVGKPLPRAREKTQRFTQLDEFQSKFYEKLIQQRKINKDTKGRSSSVKQSLKAFPGWDDTTLSNIHSLFLLFNNRINGMLNFRSFSAILESLGDTNTYEVKRKHFDEADVDNDGWLSYDEFTSLMYNMNPPKDGGITGVAKLCRETAENIKFVTNLTVGQQLEYGLF